MFRNVFMLIGVAALICGNLVMVVGIEQESAERGQAVQKGSSARELVSASRVLIIAHRGASGHAPENTLPAFVAAMDGNADLVELDYYHSSDDQIIVFHDRELDRTTDAKQRFGGEKIPTGSRTLAELRQLDAGTWFSPQFEGVRIPTLSEALTVIQPRSMTLIERKEGPAEPLVQLLRRGGLVDDVVVQAFDWEFLKRCHQLDPELVLGALGEKELDEMRLEEIRRSGARIIGWKHQDLTADNIALAHRQGFRVWTYTVNEPARARELVQWGVDGLITNVPVEIRAAVAGGQVSNRVRRD